MIRWLLLALTTLLLAPPPGAWAGPEAATPAACPPSAEFETPDESLDYFAAALKTGRPVPVLALGSASTVAPGKAGFPYYLVQTLAAAVPGTKFSLVVQGGRGRTAEAMLDDLRAVLKRQRVPLVLWQTGTVEAVQGTLPDELRLVLEDGAGLITAQGGNLVLIDPQFSRFLRANTDIDGYERAMAAAAELPGVSLFRRFDLMHDWVREGLLDLERTTTGERAAAVTLLNECLGRALARFVLEGVGR